MVPKKWIMTDFAENAALKRAQPPRDGPKCLEAVSGHRATRGTRWDRSLIAHFVSETETSHPEIVDHERLCHFPVFSAKHELDQKNKVEVKVRRFQ